MSNNISPFISEQFPSFYKEDGTFFIEFVKSYYQWLETTGNPLYHSRRLPEYIDIDLTSDDFLIRYKEKYLPGFALLNETDKRTLVKHVLDIYRSKGSIRAIKLLFKLVYNDDVDVYWPGDDILRPSDGTFKRPVYLELSVSPKTSLFVGKEVAGQQSGARAIVESVSRRNINQTYVDIVQLTNIRGSFTYGELVTADGLFEGAPRVVGSLTTLAVTSGGRNFTNGEILEVTSDVTGYGGLAKVSATINQSGQVAYTLVDGGSGYSNTATVYVSERVVGYENYRATSDFTLLEIIEQPLINVAFTSANNQYPVGSYVYGVDASNGYNTVAVAVVCNTTQNSTSFSTGNWTISDRRVEHIVIDTVAAADPGTGSFVVPESIYQRAFAESTSNTFVGRVIGANSSTIAVDVEYGVLTLGSTIRSGNLPTTANAVSTTVYNQRFTNTQISDYRLVSATNALANLQVATASYSTVNDRTATGTYIGSNTGYIGLYDISTTASFIPTTKAYVRGRISNAYANLNYLSSGSPGSFDVKTLADTENVYLNTDEISANNTSNIPFTTVALNATGYGFPKSPSANSADLLIDALTYEQFEIGTIASIGNINPGAYNTIDPIVLVRDNKVAGYGRRNYELVYENRNEFAFQPGEILQQSFSSPITTITFSTLTGNTQFDVTGIGEAVKQIRSDGKVVYGTVSNQNIAGVTKTITLTSVYATANSSNLQSVNVTFDTSNDIVGILSSASANTITLVTTSSAAVSTQGIVISSNDTFVDVKRTRFANPGISGASIIGATSGATANVTDLMSISSSLAIGENASLLTQAGSATGVATEVEVVTSGFGYVPGETVTLVSDQNPYAITAIAGVQNEGRAAGFWQSTDSFLSSDKKVQDSDYYQEFSYEIQSSLSKQVYERKVKDTVHVAGTKLFGAVNSRQTIPVPTTLPTTNTTYELSVSGALTGVFNVGDEVEGNTTNGDVTVRGTVTDISVIQTVSVNGIANVVNGYSTTFNSSSGITSNGAAATFNANASVNAGRTIIFNSNTDVVESVSFTVDPSTDISNTVVLSFNASSNVVVGETVPFNSGDVSTTTGSFSVNANTGINSGGALTINAGSDIVNAASISINADSDVVSGPRSFNASSSVTGAYKANFDVLSNRTSYSLTKWGPNPESYDYIPITSASTYISVGDYVQYNTDGTNYFVGARPPVGGLVDGQKYVVTFANTSAIKVASLAAPTVNLTWTRIFSQTVSPQVYHTVTLMTGKSITGANSTIAFTSADTYFAVGDAVSYSKSVGHAYSVPLLSPGTYYIQLANSTHIALANTAGGSRIPVVAGTSATHYLISTTNRGSTVASASASSVAAGDSVVYILAAGNTAISPLVPNDPYYVQFANATHFALSKTSGGARIALTSGISESGHTFLVANTTTGIIASSTANTFNAGDIVTYTIGTGNTAITLLQPGLNYFVKASNNTHFSLSTTQGGAIIPVRQGVSESGHFFTGINRVKATNSLLEGEIVQYVVASGNTALANLTSNGVYYVRSANGSGFSLSNSPTGSLVTLAHGTAEAGHTFVRLNELSTVQAPGHGIIPGTEVQYIANGTAITGLASNTSYFVTYANTTHLALSAAASNPTIVVAANTNFNAGDVVYQQFRGTTNTATATITSVAGNTVTVNLSTLVGRFIPGSNVYSTNASPGNQSVLSITQPQRLVINGGLRTEADTHRLIQKGTKSTIAMTSGPSALTAGDLVLYVSGPSNSSIALVSNANYYVQFANATHFALTSNTTSNERISLIRGADETHTIILQSGNSSLFQSASAADLNEGDTIRYTTSSGNTAPDALTSNTIYYVQFANDTHFALSANQSTNRISVNKTAVSETGHTFDVRGDRGTILTTTASAFAVDDSVKYIANGTAISGLSNGSVYYVQFANSTHIALSSSAGGDRIDIAKGATVDGHAITPNGVKSTIQKANQFAAGDAVKYVVSTGNTALANFTSNTQYYITFANATHFAVSTISDGPRVDLIKGKTETGHAFSTTGAAGAITVANGTAFAVGDAVVYSRDSGNTADIGLSTSANYFVEFANATHIALSSTSGGYRIPVFSNTTSEAGHNIIMSGDRSLIVADNDFTIGERVTYTASGGGIVGLSNNTTYYVQFSNATHFALSTTDGGVRKTIQQASSGPNQVFAEASINTIAVVVTSTPNSFAAFAPGGSVWAYPDGVVGSTPIVSVNIST